VESEKLFDLKVTVTEDRSTLKLKSVYGDADLSGTTSTITTALTNLINGVIAANKKGE
jgi:hypothetical protein